MDNRKLAKLKTEYDLLYDLAGDLQTELNLTEPQSHMGRPTVEETQRWADRKVLWCEASARLRDGLAKWENSINCD